jgi:succinylglutamic semialdehyde dehydrogenase
VIARGRFAHGRFIAATAGARELALRSAADQDDVIGVFRCGVDDADDAVASAAAALAGWAGLAVDARIAALARIEPPLRQRLDELSATMQRELGRPAWECQRELDGLAPRIADLCALARSHLGEPERAGAARMHHRPHGVVAVLGPAMFPIATSHHHILAALVAGNTVVWKPSPLVAASAQIYVEVLHAAGLPPGAINLVQGDAAAGQQLIAHPGVDAAVFAGSRDSAREIRRATCDRLDLTVMLHVGGKNPAIVLDGADLDRAAGELALAAFLTAGQRCTATSRVLVQAALLDPLLEALVTRARALASHLPGIVGPMFSRERYEQFLGRLAAAQAGGASPVLRPETRLDSLRVGPSIHLVTERDGAADYLSGELFGPDLAVEPVADLAAATARLRGQGTLFASLFSSEPDSWQQFQREVRAGALLWNPAPVAVSGRLAFAAPGAAERGARAVLAMTRRTAHCDAPTGAGLPFDVARPAAPALARAQGGRS